MENLLFWILEHYSHLINDTAKLISIFQCYLAVVEKCPLSAVKASKLVFGCEHNIAILFVYAYAVEYALIFIFGVLSLFLFSVDVVVIIELVERAVGTACSNEAWTIC